MEKYYIFFSYSAGIGPKMFLRLLEYFATAEKIYNAAPDELINAGLKGKNLEKYLKFKKEFNLQDILGEIKRKNIWVISHSKFPEGLKSISNPPIVLYGRGDKSLLKDKNMIGIVGSRRPTSYGVSVAQGFTRELVESGFTIVSGMALGIDGIAHRTCLKSHGKTIAVLGSGVDLPTPAEHSSLYSEIIKNGGAVVSEFPLGTNPTKGSFPARNRIISALSQAIFIPEAAEVSGALITATEAFSQEKKVFVVPGPITSSLSKGTNSLIRKGGIAVGGVGEIIRELGIKNYELRKSNNKLNGLNFSKEEKKILKLIENESLTIDQIARIAKIPAGKLMSILSDLELKSIIKNDGGAWSLVFLK